jgi:hypothetical protein
MLAALNAQAYTQAHFPKEDPHWDPIMAEIICNLNYIRSHYWEAWRKWEKGHEHEQNIRGPPRD